MYMYKSRIAFIFLLLVVSFSGWTQKGDTLSVVKSPEDPLSLEDTLSVFALIDSLLAIEENEDVSQLALRLGYNSNVMAAGRTLGIQNFGLSAGTSYYHKLGFYAETSSFWSKDFVPKYYLTIGSLGYAHTFNKHLYIGAEYNRYWYNVTEESYVPYRNSYSVMPSFTFKPVVINLNYYFYSGDKQAHRMLPVVGVRLKRKNLLGIQRLSVFPSVGVLFGNTTVYLIEYIPPKSLREAIKNKQIFGTPDAVVVTSKNVFGIMNYSINVPLTVSHNNWMLTVSYSYNIPRALSGETLSIPNSHYLSANLTYFFDLKRKKMPWE